MSKRNIMLAILALLLISPALALQSKEFSETVPFSPGDRLVLDTYKGSIHITSWDRPEVSIFARIAPPEGEDRGYAAEVVEATRVQVQQSKGRVSIKSDYSDVPSKRSGWWSESKNLAFVHYEIKAPGNLDLRIEDYKSDIELYDLAGEFDLETYKGTVKAANLDGRLRLDTYKGTADLSGLQGRIDVETYKGEIALQALRINGDSRLDTYKGNIRLEVPEGQEFDVVTDLGKRAELQGNVFRSGSATKRGNGNSPREAAGPRLEIKSHKGDIRLTRQ